MSDTSSLWEGSSAYDEDDGTGWPDEWGSAIVSGDATKLAELVLVWSGSKPERALSILRDCVSLLEKEVAFSAPASPAVLSPPTTPEPTRSSCLNAFTVALDDTCDGKRWYTSTKELQLTSLEFCIACRNYQTMNLKVDSEIPRRLLAAADAPPLHPQRLGGTRVPRLKARRVTWNMPTAAELREPVFAMTDVDRLEFGRAFEGSLETVAWPRRLRTINLFVCVRFNKQIELVDWPASLQTLVLGCAFRQPIECVEFPPSLQQLQLGFDFNQPIERVSWPASLRQLTLFGRFNQSIEGTVWPDSLQRLVFGHDFNQPVSNVRWPASLQEIAFGCLEDKGNSRMMIDSNFDQGIDRSAWPASLQQLTLGHKFRQSLQGLGTWMPNLEALRLLSWDHMVQHNSLLRGIEWPKGLRELTVSDGSILDDLVAPNLDGVVIPSTVQVHRVKIKPTAKAVCGVPWLTEM